MLINVLIPHDVIQCQSIIRTGIHAVGPGIKLYILGVGSLAVNMQSRADYYA